MFLPGMGRIFLFCSSALTIHIYVRIIRRYAGSAAHCSILSRSSAAAQGGSGASWLTRPCSNGIPAPACNFTSNVKFSPPCLQRTLFWRPCSFLDFGNYFYACVFVPPDESAAAPSRCSETGCENVKMIRVDLMVDKSVHRKKVFS